MGIPFPFQLQRQQLMLWLEIGHGSEGFSTAQAEGAKSAQRRYLN
uniref:Uncharacterized protein n=1 Tax=Arundo donax TaxID=35708 RepID=A0A0A8ZGJ4_ARUDO